MELSILHLTPLRDVLTGHIPHQLGNLVHLTQLALSENNLTGEFRDWFMRNQLRVKEREVDYWKLVGARVPSRLLGDSSNLNTCLK